MQVQLISDATERLFALVLSPGDEVIASLVNFVVQHQVQAASFTAIGAFEDVTVGYFDWDEKAYRPTPLHEQVEVLSLVGVVASGVDGVPAVHAHVVLGRADATVRGGHLLEGLVRPTLEVMLTEASGPLQRRYDPASGLDLIAIKPEARRAPPDRPPS